MTGDIVITGIGTVSPAGIGGNALLSACNGNVSCIREVSRFKARAGEVIGFFPEEHIKDKRFRRIADISKYAIASATLAIDDASLKMRSYRPERTGLIMCITHGAIGYSSRFHSELVNGGPRAASPLLFSDSVLNAPAGNLSNYLGIKGSVHTLIGGSAVAIDAIRLAARLLLSEKIDCCIVGAAEELNEITYHTYSRFGFEFPVGEGAAMFLLERKKDALEAGRRPYALIKGISSGFFSEDRSLISVFIKCLDDAGLSPDDLSEVFVNFDRKTIKEYLLSQNRNLRIRNAVGLFGEAFCVTTFFHAAVSSIMIRDDDPDISYAMVNALSIEGSAGALLLSKT